MNRSYLLALAFVLATLAAACGGGGGKSTPTTPPSTDTVAITSITPATGTHLKGGVDQTFSATVSYTLNSAASGTIVLIFEDQNFNVLNVGDQVTKTVTGGQGTATISDHVVVPFLGSGVTEIQVIIPLTPAGAATTKVSATAVFPISS
ncbi:MAG TPA: hypothetical protein VOA87_04080 [Thermoanaerobaculia bacterium]|nr:hypothetical protein [Thermoanaerobaculia bacterium]